MTQQTAVDSKALETVLKHFLETGGVFKDAHGISDTEMETVYAVGYNLYNAGKYQEAEDIFRFLCFFDHMEPKYWMGLGAVWQMMGRYEKAVDAYSYATLLDIDDPRPALHAADCYLMLNNKEAAESALSATLEFSGDDPAKKPYRERAEALLEMIRKEKASNAPKEG